MRIDKIDYGQMLQQTLDERLHLDRKWELMKEKPLRDQAMMLMCHYDQIDKKIFDIKMQIQIADSKKKKKTVSSI